MTDPMHDNSANWTRGPLKLYFNRDDPRLIVPKYVSWMGWTINFAHPVAPLAMLLAALAPVIAAVAIVTFR